MFPVKGEGGGNKTQQRPISVGVFQRQASSKVRKFMWLMTWDVFFFCRHERKQTHTGFYNTSSVVKGFFFQGSSQQGSWRSDHLRNLLHSGCSLECVWKALLQNDTLIITWTLFTKQINKQTFLLLAIYLLLALYSKRRNSHFNIFTELKSKSKVLLRHEM